MPRNNNRNNRNNRNNKANNKRVSSNNEEQLELIKINVDKVKKDVSEISIHTRKEITAITKKMDQLIGTMEKSMKVVANQSAASAKTMQKMNEEQLKSLEVYNDLLNKKVDSEKKALNYQKQQTKESTKQNKNNNNNNNNFSRGSVDEWLADYESKKFDKSNMISKAMKGDTSALFTNKVNKSMNDVLTQMKNLEANDSLDSSFKKKQISLLADQYKSLDKSAGKIELASKVFDTSISILNKTIKLWSDRFFNGMEKIIGNYENTFQNQAVMTGISQQEYFDYQNDQAKKLDTLGLKNNIAMSEVMTATSSFVDKGITNFAEASEMGQTAAIGKVLAPYLDQQSDAYISLSQSMGPKFTKTVTGLATSVSSQVGQSRFIVKNIDTMVNDMQYMTLAARKSLMSEDMQNRFELVGKITGTSQEQLMNMYTDLTDLTTNRLEALQNGNLAQKTAAASGETTWEGLAKVYSETLGMGKGFDVNSAQGQLAFDAFRQSTGTTDVIGYGNADNIDMIQKILSASDSELSELIKQYGTSDGNPDSGEESYEKKMQELANDQLQTTKDMKDIYMENMSTNLATLAEKFPDTYQIIKDIGPSIASSLIGFLGGRFIEKIGGKLLGKAGSKILSTGGKGLLSKVSSKIVTGGKSLAETGYLKALYAKDAVKAAAPKALGTLASGLGKGGLYAGGASTAVAATAGIAGGIYGLYATGKDAIEGSKKAKEWIGNDSTQAKVSSGIGAAIGGTGPGLGDEGSAKDKAKNIGGNALKGAALGAAVGSIIPGVGTAIGAAVGTAAGAIGGAIGGEKLAKAANTVADTAKGVMKTVGGFLSDRWKDAKEFGSKMGDAMINAFKDLGNFITTIPGKIVKGLKWGMDSFVVATQNMFSALLNIPIFLANTAIGLVNGVKNSVKNFAVNIANKIGQGDNVSSWFPEDMPTMSYSQMQQMPDINSYATGTNYIKTNGELAYLHEGEAVLTKSAATLLRTETNENISTATGVSSALDANSSITKEYITTIVTAINDQTAALVAKMDEIYQKVIASNYRGKFSSTLVGLKTN